MALEDRVKTLEYELNVLKNEIQSTLLDIQEQILTHYYPSLRSEESSPPEAVLRSSNPILATRAREVQEERSPALRSEEGADWTAFTELAEWVGNSVERIGGERTRKVIEGCARGGQLAAGSRDILLQLIALGDEETGPEKVGMKVILDVIMELNAVLGNGSDIGDALSLLEGEDLG